MVPRVCTPSCQQASHPGSVQSGQIPRAGVAACGPRVQSTCGIPEQMAHMTCSLEVGWVAAQLGAQLGGLTAAWRRSLHGTQASWGGARARRVVCGQPGGLVRREVGEEGPAPAGEQYVLALDVPVAHAARVGLGDRVQQLAGDPQLRGSSRASGPRGHSMVQVGCRPQLGRTGSPLLWLLARQTPRVQTREGRWRHA